jgi:hypothetical protein
VDEGQTAGLEMSYHFGMDGQNQSRTSGEQDLLQQQVGLQLQTVE